MFKLKQEDEKFLLANIPDMKQVIEAGNKLDIQDAFYEWMDVNCFDEESEGFFNLMGKKAQIVWDSIRDTE